MISPLAHVDPSAKIGKDVTIHPFAFIDANVEIGDGCEIMPYTSIINGTRMGRNNKVYQGSIIGADPQDFRWKGDQTYCFIGENNTIREHVFIMAKSHIGHDSELKGRSVIGNGVAIAGDAVIDECTILSSGVIVHEKAHVGKWVLVKGGCRIGSNVPPFAIFAHNPVEFFGVNAVVMRKHDFSEDDIQNAAKSYRHIYQTQTSVFNAMKRIEADIEPGIIKDEIMKFIDDNNSRLVAIPRELQV